MFKNGMRPVRPGEVLREDYLVPLKIEQPESTPLTIHSSRSRTRFAVGLIQALGPPYRRMAFVLPSGSLQLWQTRALLGSR